MTPMIRVCIWDVSLIDCTTTECTLNGTEKSDLTGKIGWIWGLTGLAGEYSSLIEFFAFFGVVVVVGRSAANMTDGPGQECEGDRLLAIT